MATTLLALIEEHHHQLPDDGVISAAFDHPHIPEAIDRAIDMVSIAAALATFIARCLPCQERVSTWLATHADPRTIVRLVVPVARDAYRLALRWVRAGAHASKHSAARLGRSMLSAAFGRDVLSVADRLSAGDVSAAVEHVRGLRVERRVVLVQSLLEGIAHPPTPALLKLAATRPA